MATGEDGGGARPPAGVTFLGIPAVRAQEDVYRLRQLDGTVEGPLATGVLLQRIRDRLLTGSEGVSRDGSFWIPMMAIPQFRDAFDGHEPLAGMTSMGQSVSDDADGPRVVSAAGGHYAAPVRPAPLAESGQGVMGSTGRDAFRSGGWSVPGDDGLSVSGPSRGGTGSPLRPEPAGGSELPQPRGFMGLPQVTEDSGALPLIERGLRSAGHGPLPVSRGSSTLFFDELDDIPELPVSSQMGLPRSASTLAMSAESGFPGLPSNVAGLPVSASAFPAPASSAPVSAAWAPMSSSMFGSGASGFPLSAAPLPGVPDAGESEWPVSKSPLRTMDLSALGAAPASELPASSRTQGPSLEEIGNASLWDDDDDQISGSPSRQERGGAALMASAARFDFDDDPFADDRAWQSQSDVGADSESSPFFSEDDQPSPPMAAPPPAVSRGRAGSGKALRFIAAGAVVVALGAAVAMMVPRLRTVAEETVEGTGAVVMAEPTPVVPVAVASVVGELSSLKFAGPAQLREFMASAAVSATSSGDDRAKVLIAQCLHQMFVPTETDAIAAMRSLYDGLVVVDGADAELVALARGAFEAVSGDTDPAAGLEAVRDPAYVPLARLFEAFYGIQGYRGITYPAQAAAVPAVAPGFGTGTDGVVAATGGSAAPPVEGSAPAGEGSSADVAAGQSAEAAVAEGSVRAVPDAESAGADDVTAVAGTELSRIELTETVLPSLERALSADPDLGAALYWSAWTHMEVGDHTTALAGFDRLTTANDGHVPAHLGAAHALLRSGNLADADARVQRVIDEMESQSLPGERSQTYITSAEISIARLQSQLAIESLLSALQAEPGNRRALSMLGEQFYESGAYQRALEFFQSHVDLAQDDPEAIVGLVRAYLGLQMFSEATSSLEGAVARFPLDGRFPYLQGRVAEEQAEFDSAIEYYTQATQIDGSYLQPWLRLAQLAQRSADVPEAMAYLQRVPLAGLEDAALANELGEVYVSLGETNRAVGAFRRALEINQAYPNARISLAEHYLNIEEYRRALDEIRSMVDSGVDTPRVQFLHARALTAMGDYSRALEELTALVNLEADNPDYLYALGLAHFGAGDWVNARRRFAEGYELKPTMSDAMYYMGRCDIERSAYREAISELSTVSMRSSKGEYHYWLGFALEQNRQQQQAFSEYSKAVGDDIGWSLENPEVFFRRAEIFFQRGAPSQARGELQILLTLRPRHAGALRLLGRLHFDARNFVAAIAAWELSLVENSDQPETRYYMGRAWLEREPADLQRAMLFLEQARDGGVADARPDLHQRLGYLYRDLGRSSDAVTSLGAYLLTPDLSADERRNTENIINEMSGVR